MDILYHFILYFKERANPIIKKSHQSKLQLQTQPNNHLNLLINNDISTNDLLGRKKQFLRQTRIHKYVFEEGIYKGIQLTDREIDCVMCLLDSKTAQQTAEVMNISRRTVESYLNNIKTKLNCNSKNELFTKLKAQRFSSFIR